MTDDKRPRSMRDFDYFAEGVEPLLPSAPDAGGDSAGEGRLHSLFLRRRRALRVVLLTAITFAAVAVFLWTFRQHMVYVLGAAREPRDLGNVADMTPLDIPHNEYVKVSGITELRGLTQNRFRGLALFRQELWYFRLMGSGGVFIEVVPDKKAYSFAAEVTVAGRAVDPTLDSSYDSLLEDYHERYHAERREALRVIQVGVAPGEGRWPYLLVGLALLVLGAVNVSMLARVLKVQRILGALR